MLPFTKTVWAGSAPRTAEQNAKKSELPKIFIGRRSSRFRCAASSAQRFNANHVNSFILLFCFLKAFPYGKIGSGFSSPPPRMEKHFLLPTRLRFIELPPLSGPLRLTLNSTTLSAAHPNHQPEPFLSWRLRPR